MHDQKRELYGERYENRGHMFLRGMVSNLQTLVVCWVGRYLYCVSR
jgi:hypothetical protein